MYKYSIIIFIKNLNNLSCLSSYKIIFYQYIYIFIIFKFSKLANVFPISKRGYKRIQISFKTLEIRNFNLFFSNFIKFYLRICFICHQTEIK